MIKNILGCLKSFWVGNWFSKLTQTVLFLNILISIFYIVDIIWFLLLTPDPELGILFLGVIPLLLVAACINVALMFYFKSSKSKWGKPVEIIKTSFFAFLGYYYFCFIILMRWLLTSVI